MAVNLANYFHNKEVPNLLISTRMGGRLSPLVKNRQDLVVFSKRSFVDVFTFFAILKSIKKFRPTILHAHDSSIFWAVMVKFFLPQTVLVWHAHYGGFSSANDRFGRKIKYIEKGIDRVIVVNRDLLNWVRQNFSKIPKVAQIGNFPDQIAEAKIKRDNSKWIISVANFKPPKDHKTLILAFSRFLESYPEFQLALIGTQEDSVYVQEVLNLIQEKNLQKSIKLTGPVIDLNEWFSKARLGILSSTVEGLPVSLLELGLSGIPVICSAVGACSDLLEHGACGALVPIKDDEAMAQALIHAVRNPEETNQKAGLFYQKIIREFGGDNFFKEYSTLIYSA